MADVLKAIGETGSLRYAAELHASLDGRYYPKYVRDTGIGIFYEALGDALQEIDASVTQTYQDQFVEECRISPVLGRQQTKLWDNFGSFVGPDLNAYQDPETMQPLGATGSGWQGYRREVIALGQAAMAAGTRQALESVGEAFTGMSPVVLSHYNTPRWKLKHATGSIDSVSSAHISIARAEWFPRQQWVGAHAQQSLDAVRGPTSPPYGRPCKVTRSNHNTLYFDSTRKISDKFTVGKNFVVTFSRLGHNTRLYGAQDRFFGVTAYCWIPGYVTAGFRTEDFSKIGPGVSRQTVDGFKTFLAQAVRDFTPGHVRTHLIFQDHYSQISTQTQLASGSYDPTQFVVADACVTNVGSMETGSWISSTMTLQTPRGWTWFPDWMVRLVNEAQAQFYLRFAATEESLTGSWHPVVKNVPISAHYVERYAQFKVEVSASGSNDVRLYGVALKGIFDDMSATLFASADILYKETPVPWTPATKYQYTPFQYGELVDW